MAKKKPLPPPSCADCFYSKEHSRQDVWCQRHPTHKVVYKIHWCGDWFDIVIAEDLGHRKGA